MFSSFLYVLKFSIIKGLKWRYYYLPVGWNGVFCPAANLEARWTVSSLAAARSVHGSNSVSTPWLYPFCYNRVSHCTPWGHKGDCSSTNPRSEEAPDSGFLHPPLASSWWSWSWPRQVPSSLGHKGLTLHPWNDWVSLWSVLPFRLMPAWWLSTDQLDHEFVVPEYRGNWLGLPKTETCLHLASPPRLK